MSSSLCSYCYIKVCWSGFVYCKECYDLVLLASEEITFYDEPNVANDVYVEYNHAIMPVSYFSEYQVDAKEEREFKDPMSYEDLVDAMKVATSESQYLELWKQIQYFVGSEEPVNGYHKCPLCKTSIIIDQANCKVFRCATLVDGGYVDPHAKLDTLIELRKTGILIAGCMAPLELNQSTSLYIPTDKDGNPYYY